MSKDQQSSPLGGAEGRTNFASSLRVDAPIRQAARLVIEEMGARAGKYSVWRALALKRQGDLAGASAWRRVAPVIQALDRERIASSGATVEIADILYSERWPSTAEVMDVVSPQYSPLMSSAIAVTCKRTGPERRAF